MVEERIPIEGEKYCDEVLPVSDKRFKGKVIEVKCEKLRQPPHTWHTNNKTGSYRLEWATGAEVVVG